MRYFKVTNLAATPVYRTWTKALLDDEDIAAYEAYQETPEFLGIDAEDRIRKKKIPFEVRMRPFFQSFGKDVLLKSTDLTIQGRQARVEWRFAIGPNVEKIMKDNDLPGARRMCEKLGIPISVDTSLKEIAELLAQKFGPNERILNERQWLESGLKALERKEIKLRLKPGEIEQKIIYAGHLVAEELSELEIKSSKEENPQKDIVKESVSQSPAPPIDVNSLSDLSKDQLIDQLATLESINSSTLKLKKSKIIDRIKSLLETTDEAIEV